MTFTSSIEEINQTRRLIKITAPLEIVNQAYQEAVTSVREKADIKGFRKGKVPEQVVRKFLQEDILKKAVNEVMNNGYNAILKTLDLQIVSKPEANPESPFEENKNFDFSILVDINPVIEMQNYKDIEIKLDEKWNVPNFDKMVDDEIDRFAVYRSTVQTLESEEDTVQLNDAAVLSTLYFIDGQENAVKTLMDDIYYVAPKPIYLPELQEHLLNAKIGETKTVSVKFQSDNSDKNLADKNGSVRFTITKIQRLLKPTIDDSFAEKIGYKNIEEARFAILQSVQTRFENEKLDACFEQFSTHLLNQNQFEVAESLVESTQQKMENQYKQEKNKEKPSAEKIREEALKQVKTIIAFGHIARQENIQVSEQEMIHEMTQFKKENNVDLHTLFKKQGRVLLDEFKGRVIIDKVLKRLYELAQVSYASSES